MKLIKNMITILTVLVIMTMPMSAQSELRNPGITPDSPFYFMDRFFDEFQSTEAIVDERAAEIIAMAEKGHERGLEKAMEGYEKALEKRRGEAEKNEKIAEEVALQTSNHMAILARVREQVPEQAKAGIDQALTESAMSRENALVALEKQNPERADAVAKTTLEKLKTGLSEEAQEDLQRALEAGRARAAAESGETGRY